MGVKRVGFLVNKNAVISRVRMILREVESENKYNGEGM